MIILKQEFLSDCSAEASIAFSEMFDPITQINKQTDPEQTSIPTLYIQCLSPKTIKFMQILNCSKTMQLPGWCTVHVEVWRVKLGQKRRSVILEILFRLEIGY